MGMEKISALYEKKKAVFIGYCKEHKVLMKAMTPVRSLWQKIGFGRYLHDINPETRKMEQDKHERYLRSDDQHKEEINRLFDMLEDDLSRYTLEKVLAYRQSWDKTVLTDIISYPPYFQKDIFGPVKDEVFVDGGAYIGDTIESFVNEFGGGYKKIYAWEPDTANLVALRKNTRKYSDIVCVPYGLWSGRTTLCFSSRGYRVSEISMVVEGGGADTDMIEVDSIDNVCRSDKVTFIKMDIEGSEQAALEGAIDVIKRDKPRLAICIYHKPEDLFEIPFWIKETVPEYKLYMRHHSDFIADTVIYATV